MKLKHFTEDDWICYSGCGSKSPLIGYGHGTTLIVDDDYVELYADATSMPHWAFKFPDRGTAMVFALDFEGHEPDHLMGVIAGQYGSVWSSGGAK